MFCSLANAQRALPNLALMSFWPPLSLLMRLPRYLKSCTNSSGSPFTVTGALGVVLMLITCVLDVLMVSPICFAYLSNRSVFSCRWSRFTDRNARSSAKSRSSNWEKRVHWIPLGLSDVVFRITQSMTTKKRMGERIHPCLTPDFTVNHSDDVLLRMTLHSKWL